MIVKQLMDEDFVNYRKPSMFIGFPSCTFKCEKECGERVCQNSALATSPDKVIGITDIVDRYLNNPITSAIVCGGLEPFDSFLKLWEFVVYIRQVTQDDIVIYTGYKEEEIQDKIETLKEFKNIVIKFGRFVPHQESHYDEVLGVNLASPNQYARRIS